MAAAAPGPPPLIIVNPSAGGGTAHDSFRRLEHQLCDALGGGLDVAFTVAPGHATSLAREALELGRERLLVAGGDGTVHEVVQAWLDEEGRPLHPGASLALVSGGTGGDLRRTLGVTSTEDALAAVRSGRTRTLDLGRLTYTEPSGGEARRLFVNIASAGLGGEVDERVGSLRFAGRFAYAAATAMTLLGWDNPVVRIHLKGGEQEFESEMPAASIVVANGAYFGGGMHVAPRALPDDGLFHVIILGDIGNREMLGMAPALFRGTHLEHPRVLAKTATSVRLDSDTTVKLDVDGEPLGRLPASMELLPARLPVAIP